MSCFVLAGVVFLLAEFDIQLVGEAMFGFQAVSIIQEQNPDIVIISLP